MKCCNGRSQCYISIPHEKILMLPCNHHHSQQEEKIVPVLPSFHFLPCASFLALPTDATIQMLASLCQHPNIAIQQLPSCHYDSNVTDLIHCHITVSSPCYHLVPMLPYHPNATISSPKYYLIHTLPCCPQVLYTVTPYHNRNTATDHLHLLNSNIPVKIKINVENFLQMNTTKEEKC